MSELKSISDLKALMKELESLESNKFDKHTASRFTHWCHTWLRSHGYEVIAAMSNPFPDGKPLAYYTPHLVTFKGVTRTSCPEHLQPELEGTVAWGPTLLGDGDTVTDKNGVTHKPIPLFPANAKALEPT